MTKLVHQNTYEENIRILHEKVAHGELQYSATALPKACYRILMKNVVA